jgi:hypothetical protein
VQINFVLDASVNNAPAGFLACLNAAAQYLDTLITNPITVNLQVGWGENNGTALPLNTASGGPFFQGGFTYDQLKAQLTAHATSADDLTSIANLPALDPTGGSAFILALAQEKAWGLLAANAPGLDGTLGFNFPTANFDLVNHAVPGEIDFFGVALHEITHALGRLADVKSFFSSFDALDVFRYKSPGLLETASQFNPSYFSIDGGKTNLDNFSTSSDPGDWAPSAGNDANVAFAPTGVELKFTPTDITEMDVLGFTVKPTTPPPPPLVTVQQIQDDHFGIVRTHIGVNEATLIANNINAGKSTEYQYVTGLLDSVTDTTVPAVAVEASMYNAVGSSSEVDLLTNTFLPPQIQNALAHGYNPLVYATETLGLALAFGNETGNTKFADTFGSVPDASYGTVAANAIFSAAATPNLANAIDQYLNNWKTFYSANGVLGDFNPSTIELAAKGAAWGDAVGVALDNNLGTLKAGTMNFLMDAAENIALYSQPLSSQPLHHPFQGEPLIGVHLELA